MIKATQLRPGMIIRHEGELYTVFSVDHRTPGNKRAAMATQDAQPAQWLDHRLPVPGGGISRARHVR